MNELYTREAMVSLDKNDSEGGLLTIYRPHEDTEDDSNQLWIYSNFPLGLRHITPELLLALLGHMKAASAVWTTEYDPGKVKNCFRLEVSCRYLLEYISKLQGRILELEQHLHSFPPPSAIKVLPDVFLVGDLYLTRIGKWVHVGPNLDVIKLAANGTIPKVDLPKNVKSFSSAGQWQRRVAEYCSDSET